MATAWCTSSASRPTQTNASHRRQRLQLDMPVPAWLRRDAPSEPRQRTLTPSSDDTTTFVPAKSADNRKLALAARRGCASSVAIAAERARRNTSAPRAETYLARAAKDFPPDERTKILDQILSLDQRSAILQPLFGVGSRGEVPIVGRLACRDRRARRHYRPGGPTGGDRQEKSGSPISRRIARRRGESMKFLQPIESNSRIYRAVLAQIVSRANRRARADLDRST